VNTEAGHVDGAEQGSAPGAVSEVAKGAIQSIERAAHVLALFDQDTTNLSVATVSERLGLNRTTTHRYLLSLQSSGFLSPKNGPGPLLDQLSSFISGHRRVLNLAPPVMRRLSDCTGMTVVLSLLGRSGTVVTLVEEAAVGTIVLTVRPGTILEVKASQSRVLLAFQADPAVVARYHAALPEEEVAQEQAELARVRRERVGWGDLSHLGLAAVAAPVFGSRDIQAAMALLGTDKMLPRSDRSKELVEMLRAAAESLSKLVGA
jgi:DNA-binding IclR family transcriptional regulator